MNLFNRRKFIKTTGALAGAAMLPVAAKALPAATKIESPFGSEVTPTGIPGLDEVLDGGLHKGRIYLVLGQAGSGKSLFINQVHRHCKWTTMSGPNSYEGSSHQVPRTYDEFLDFWKFAKANASEPIGLWTINDLCYGGQPRTLTVEFLRTAKEIALENPLAFLATDYLNRDGFVANSDVGVPYEHGVEHLCVDTVLVVSPYQAQIGVHVLKNRHGQSNVTIPWEWKGGFTPPTRPAVLTPATFS